MNERWERTPQRRAFVTGATGLVGRALLRVLPGNAIATTRRASKATHIEGASELVTWGHSIDGAFECPRRRRRDLPPGG
jgi:uncharacterized protein YbjT (DUF2867 family)